MSGHSKWSTIKRQKGATDAKRGLAFTKLSIAITLAVKEGGQIADPDSNFKLRLAIEAARGMNMPKENITRAIERATGKNASEVTETVYEGFGPGGFSVIVEAITDNKQRTTPLVKNVFEKNGGSMGTPGAVMYQFQQKGLILLKKNSHSFDDIFLTAVDNGAEDVEEGSDQEIAVTTVVDRLAIVKEALEKATYEIISAEIVRKPVIFVKLTKEGGVKKAEEFLQKFEDLDDVQKVYANYE